MLLGSRFKKKRFFLRLVLLTTLLCIIGVLTTTLLYSDIYSGAMNGMLRDENLKSLERLSAAFDGQLRQIQQLSVYLSQNFDIYEYLHGDTYDVNVASRSSLMLKSVRYMNDYLYSVYLYNRATDDYLLAGESKIDIRQFTQRTPAPVAAQGPLDIVFSTITPQAVNDLSSPMRTVSLIFMNGPVGGIVRDRAVIMNLDCRAINKDFLGKYGDLTMLADERGNVLFHSYNYAVDDSIASSPYYQRIVAEGMGNGSFESAFQGETAVVTYIKSDLTGLTMINIKPYGALMGAVAEKRNLILLISAVTLLVLGLFAYIASINLYKPIRKMADMAARSRFGHKSDGVEELRMISRVLDESEEAIRELEHRSEDQGAKLREDYLRRLLCSNASDAVPPTGLGLRFDNLRIAAASIDNYQNLNETRRCDCEATLIRLAREHLCQGFHCEVVNLFDGMAALFLNGEGPGGDPGQMLFALEGMKKAVSNAAGITLTVGLGGFAQSPEQCTGAYREALDMVKYRFLLGFNKLICREKIEERMLTGLRYPAELEETLTQAVMQNKKQEFACALESLTDLLRNYVYPESVRVLFQAVLSCLNAVNLVVGQENRQFSSCAEDFFNAFRHFETVDQAKSWLISVFEDYEKFVSEINSLKNNRHLEMVDKAQRHICVNFTDINLTVESIAERFGYTPYYFSRIYKEITGVNINDYIRQVRIGRAKHLLGATSLKVSDIPEKVGFTNASYFCSAFRKDVGLTPTAYREYMASRSAESGNPYQESIQ